MLVANTLLPSMPYTCGSPPMVTAHAIQTCNVPHLRCRPARPGHWTHQSRLCSVVLGPAKALTKSDTGGYRVILPRVCRARATSACSKIGFMASDWSIGSCLDL